jgi:hypothetical protein
LEVGGINAKSECIPQIPKIRGSSACRFDGIGISHAVKCAGNTEYHDRRYAKPRNHNSISNARSESSGPS